MTEAPTPAHPSRPALFQSIGPLLLLAALPVVAVLAFAIGLMLGVRGTDVTILGLSILTGTLAAIPAALDSSRPSDRRHVLISLLGLSYAIYWAAPAITQYFLAERGGSQDVMRLVNIHPSDIVRGQTVGLLGLLALLLGYAAPFGRFLSNLLPRPTREWPHGAALAVALIMIPLGWTILLASQFGLTPERLGTGGLGALASSVFFGIALLMATYLRYKSRPALLLMTLLIPPSMGFLFFMGSKKIFFAPLIMVVLTRILVTRRVRLRWVIGGVMALVIIYPLSEFYRQVISRGRSLSAVEVLRDPVGAVSLMSNYVSYFEAGEYLRAGLEATGHRMNALGIACVIVRETPARVPYQGGWSIAYIPLSFVPRLFWANKPTTTIGQWVTDNYTTGPIVRSNTGPSWVGELYFNFGIPGVIAGMVAIGIYFRLMHEIVFRRVSTIPATLAGVVVLWSTAPSMGSGLITPINSVMFSLIPLVAAHVAIRLSTPTPRTKFPRP